MFKKLLLASVASLTSLSSASASHTWSPSVKVIIIQMDNSGDLIVTLSAQHGDTTCSSQPSDLNRYRLDKNSTLIYETATALLTTAVVSGVDVELLGQGCIGTLPSLQHIRMIN